MGAQIDAKRGGDQVGQAKRSSNQSPAAKQRKRRARLMGLGFGVIIVVIIAAATSSSGPVTRAEAIQNVVNKIDSGPNWETVQDPNAVAGYRKWEETDNGNDGGGACAYANERNAKAGFACYLQASDSHGGNTSYFSENASGGDIHPISFGQYNGLFGPA